MKTIAVSRMEGNVKEGDPGYAVEQTLRFAAQDFPEHLPPTNPEEVHEKIKSNYKHLLFSESVEEREIRVDSEHATLVTWHQFEPLFERLIAELEEILGWKRLRENASCHIYTGRSGLPCRRRSDEKSASGPERQISGQLGSGKRRTSSS